MKNGEGGEEWKRKWEGREEAWVSMRMPWVLGKGRAIASVVNVERAGCFMGCGGRERDWMHTACGLWRTCTLHGMGGFREDSRHTSAYQCVFAFDLAPDAVARVMRVAATASRARHRAPRHASAKVPFFGLLTMRRRLCAFGHSLELCIQLELRTLSAPANALIIYPRYCTKHLHPGTKVEG